MAEHLSRTCTAARPTSAAVLLSDINLRDRQRALEPRAREMAARLCLPRPLVIVNLATTGALRRHDRVVAIFAVKLWPSGDTFLRLDTVNPARPIAPEATAAHGISDADISCSPAFVGVAAAWQQFLAGCDIAGVDCEGRDIALLQAECYRAGIDVSLTGRRVDARRVLLDCDRRDLQAAVRFDSGRASESGDQRSGSSRGTGRLHATTDPTDVGADDAGMRRSTPHPAPA
ncbi:MAG: hypothetical protein OXC71_05245 [Chloroflexi bacterium]|nr:hypothetical protein [Chloroflexota bacterium]